MFKFLVRVVVGLAAVFGALLGLSYFQSKKNPRYVDIYSDIDEDETDNEMY